MTLDPDGCTFWYTNEYANPLSQAANKRWKTKIGKFTYPPCTPVGAGGTIAGNRDGQRPAERRSAARPWPWAQHHDHERIRVSIRS